MGYENPPQADVLDGFAVEEVALFDPLLLRKELMHERSKMDTELRYLGTLANEQNKGAWNAEGISLARRLESGDVTDAELEPVTERLERSFVSVSVGAALRCVDGSMIAGYDDQSKGWLARPLGPQIAGGTVGLAYVARLVKGFDNSGHITLLGDIEAEAARPSIFAPGDHTDVHASHATSGCGAVDGIPKRNAMLLQPDTVTKATATLDALAVLTNQTFKDRPLADMQEAAQHMIKQPDYLPIADKLLEHLRLLNSQGVETLQRPHGEVSVTINFVTGTTFHRDHYAAMTGGKIQNFNLDAWHITEEHGSHAYALLLDSILTLMDLTDGSQRLYVRLPK